MLHRSQIRLSGATQTGNRKSSYDFLFLKRARGGGHYSQHLDEWYKPTRVRVQIHSAENLYPSGREPNHDFMMAKSVTSLTLLFGPVSDLDVAKSLRVVQNGTQSLSLRPTASNFADSAASSPAVILKC